MGKAPIFVAKWLRRHISAAMMTQLRTFALPMSLADELMALIWAYMSFNQVSVDFERFNRYENLKPTWRLLVSHIFDCNVDPSHPYPTMPYYARCISSVSNIQL
ncbi:hypothetical protein N7520_002020 [Penicillium odoratum]|uniref:uncharacterized protein n=1 Tax=Penicillium odoratum TaxID=1167516 RepID=UPI00254945D5|nr:uncharacterized protein N7520_002020 [Penicillium odoratum]KAJ5778774.1 hypothetical protein N7520_002020 [Penicillium odoratum]